MNSGDGPMRPLEEETHKLIKRVEALKAMYWQYLKNNNSEVSGSICMRNPTHHKILIRLIYQQALPIAMPWQSTVTKEENEEFLKQLEILLKRLAEEEKAENEAKKAKEIKRGTKRKRAAKKTENEEGDEEEDQDA